MSVTSQSNNGNKNPNLYSKTKLGKYLIDRNESAYDFVKYARISLATIYKILNGEKIRKDVARRLVRVTKKHLTLEDFGYETKA